VKTYLKEELAAQELEQDFYLLNQLERGEEIEGLTLCYEIVEDHTGPLIGGSRVGRWKMDERVRVGRVG
jgi:hypothetical protein